MAPNIFFFGNILCLMLNKLKQSTMFVLSNKYLPPASEGWGKVLFSVCLSVHTSTGGRGTRSSLGRGGPGLRSGGGYPVSGPGGYPVSGLGGGYPVSVKGKIFDTRFGLIHV